METHTGATRSTVSVTRVRWRSLLLWTLIPSETTSWVLELAWGPIRCVLYCCKTNLTLSMTVELKQANENCQDNVHCITVISTAVILFEWLKHTLVFSLNVKQHTLADVWVQKTSEMETTQQYHCRTFLGHLLNIGDLVLGWVWGQHVEQVSGEEW